MKRIAVLSDIHGNFFLLDKVLSILKNENIDEYIFCGDHITDGFDNNKVLDLIRGLTQNIIAGNREVAISSYDGKAWENLYQWKPNLYVFNNLSKDNLEYISNLPIYKQIEIEGKKICISHGTPSNVRELIYPDSYDIFDQLLIDYPSDIYLFAHSHRPFSKEYKGKLFINVGAISLPAHNKAVSSYVVLILDNENVEVIEKEYHYDFDEVKEYYVKSDYHKECPEWSNLLIYLLRDGYDYCCDFIDSINKSNTGKSILTEEIYKKKYKEYMEEKGLDIL